MCPVHNHMFTKNVIDFTMVFLHTCIHELKFSLKISDYKCTFISNLDA